MSLNNFFLLVLGLLILIFVVYKPDFVATQNEKDIPLLELENFTLYELNTSTLTSTMQAKRGLRYKNHYEAYNVSFKNKSSKLEQTINGNKAFYDTITLILSGDVHYKREDGLNFLSQYGKYSKKTKIFETNSSYLSYRDKDTIIGDSLSYDTQRQLSKSKNIKAVFNINENNK